MAGGVINTGSNPKLLWPGIKSVWGMAYNEHATEYTDLFDTVQSDKNYEEYVQDTMFGLAPQKPEGQNTMYDTSVQGFVARGVNVSYGLGYIVTHEEQKDNLYMTVVKRRTPSLAFSFRQSKENIGANIYNRAFNALYLGADGVSLANTAHPNTNGGIYSNKPTVDVDLSEAALEDGTIAVMNFQDDRGLRINLMPESLHVATAEWFNANRILKSVYQSGTANNDINVLKATNTIPKGIKVNHYFSSPHAWFLRTNLPKDGMIYQEREAISFEQDNDFDSKNHKYAGYERYTFLWADGGRAIYCSNGP